MMISRRLEIRPKYNEFSRPYLLTPYLKNKRVRSVFHSHISQNRFLLNLIHAAVCAGSAQPRVSAASHGCELINLSVLQISFFQTIHVSTIFFLGGCRRAVSRWGDTLRSYIFFFLFFFFVLVRQNKIKVCGSETRFTRKATIHRTRRYF